MNFTTQVEATARRAACLPAKRPEARGDTIAAYGAAAKGNTLLNYAGIGPELISYCVDRNPAKQNTLAARQPYSRARGRGAAATASTRITS